MSQPGLTQMTGQQLGYAAQPFPSQASIAPQMSVGSQLALYQHPNQYPGMMGQLFPQPGTMGYMQPPMSQPYYQTPPPAPPAPAPTPQPVKEDSTNTALLSETRHQTTEVRMELTKLTSKIEEISTKVCVCVLVM